MVWEIFSSLGSFFLKLKPKNIQNAAIFTFFITLFFGSLILIALGVKFPSGFFEKWVSQGDKEETYYCETHWLDFKIKCSLDESNNFYSIVVSHTEDKAIIRISQPQDYTMPKEGISAYKGYQYFDGKIKLIVKDVGPTRGVNIKVITMTASYLWIVVIVSIIGVIWIFYKNNKIPNRDPSRRSR